MFIKDIFLYSTERFKRFEYMLVTIYVLLLSTGFIVLQSAVMNSAREGDAEKQVIWICLSVFVFLLTIFLPEKTIKMLIPVVFGIIFLSLAGVLLMPAVKGSRRWINLSFFRYQPSEFFKIAEIMILSLVLAMKEKKFYYIVTLFIFISAVLIYKEPDLGTTIISLAIWWIMTFLSGKHENIWKFSMLGGILGSPVIYFLMDDYQKNRILGFIYSTDNSSGISYNTTQALKAIGSGGLTGKGYMNGFMNLGNFVPEDSTDFISSVIGEEFGFLGMFFVVLLFTLLIIRLYQLYKMSRSDFWKFYYAGTAFLIFFHVYENIGMNIGIMPVTGIVLPFISYGGGSAITFSILIAFAVKGSMINKNIK